MPNPHPGFSYQRERARQGLTQRQAAEVAGVSYRTMVNAESNSDRVSDRMHLKIQEALVMNRPEGHYKRLPLALVSNTTPPTVRPAWATDADCGADDDASDDEATLISLAMGVAHLEAQADVDRVERERLTQRVADLEGVVRLVLKPE